MMSYLMRLVLPNRPGALGALATALGNVGADIQNLIVVERNADLAVDDILVDLPPTGLADSLITAAHSVDGVTVESLNRYGGRLDLQDDLALLDTLTGGSDDLLARFANAVPDVLRAEWALIVDAGVPHAPAIAASPAAPTQHPRLEWLATATRIVDPREVWDNPAVSGPDPQLAAAPMGGRSRAVLVGRRGGPQYRQSELLRLHHLAAVVAAVAAAPVAVGQ